LQYLVYRTRHRTRSLSFSTLPFHELLCPVVDEVDLACRYRPDTTLQNCFKLSDHACVCVPELLKYPDTFYVSLQVHNTYSRTLVNFANSNWRRPFVLEFRICSTNTFRVKDTRFWAPQPPGLSFVATSTVGARMPSRRSHEKSHHGCVTCKRRRVKASLNNSHGPATTPADLSSVMRLGQRARIV
jgi:hypothetical protein